MRRRLDEVSGRRKIEPGARGAALERAAEIERGFVRLDAGRGEPKRGLRRIMRRQLPRRVRDASRRARPLDRRPKRRLDRLPRHRARTQQLRPGAKTGDDRRIRGHGGMGPRRG